MSTWRAVALPCVSVPAFVVSSRSGDGGGPATTTADVSITDGPFVQEQTEEELRKIEEATA